MRTEIVQIFLMALCVWGAYKLYPHIYKFIQELKDERH